MLGVAVLAIWALATSAILFGLLSHFKMLRVPHDDEVAGLDVSHHGGAAYNMDDSDMSNAAVAMKRKDAES